MWAQFKRVIKLVISVCFWSGSSLYGRCLGIIGKKQRVLWTILYYHSVTRENQRRFARQMAEMEGLAKVIPADTDAPLSEANHYVSLTFDDGFQSVFENALPELIKRSIPAAVFIPTGYLGRRPNWIEDHCQDDRGEVVMTGEQIKGLPADLITIGSHAVSHSHLRQIGAEVLRRELIESRSKLQGLTGREITLLSLPHGEYDDDVLELALQTGYRRVFCSLPWLAKEGDPLFGRVHVKPSDWRLEFRLKILGAYRWFPFMLGLKRKLSVSNALRAAR